MEEILSKAAIDGDVHILWELMAQDKLILHKIHVGWFKTNPFHVAISRNNVEFVKELLQRNNDLAEVLDSGRSPLHLAAAKGNKDIVSALIDASKEMCLARDPDGRNPIHVAAMKGKVEVLRALVMASPNAARAKLDRNETILHLCVKHGQLNTLKLLLEMDIGIEFINAKDNCGNTILHLAVSGKNFDIVKHIVNYDHRDVGLHRKRKKLEVNVVNAEGHTALDIVLLAQNGEYKDFLLQAGCKRTKDLVQRDWLSEKRGTLMVVASLIATMAFQAAVSPPGGVWQDNSDGHKAGFAVMADNYPKPYANFLRVNTIAFVTSLSMILLLISDVPFKNRLVMWCLLVIMWLTITSTAIAYAISISVVTPKKDKVTVINTVLVGVIVWCSVMALLLVYHTYMLIKDSLDDYRSKSQSKKNIDFGYGNIDPATGKPTQSIGHNEYAGKKLPACQVNGNEHRDIQMV